MHLKFKFKLNRRDICPYAHSRALSGLAWDLERSRVFSRTRYSIFTNSRGFNFSAAIAANSRNRAGDLDLVQIPKQLRMIIGNGIIRDIIQPGAFSS